MLRPDATPPRLAVSRRLRATPYTPRVEALGVSDYTVVNHTILPKGFGRTVAEDYWHLRTHVQLWDVSCQRQVSLEGPDAARLLQLMTPRDMRDAAVGQCRYVPLIDERAGMINDPVVLRLAADRFWLSIADSDVLLWAKGLALGYGLDVAIEEPPVAPLAVQGPASETLMSRVFGEGVRRIGFFRFAWLDFHGRPLLVARSGYSKQGGFEIYLDEPSLALPLWDSLWRAGADLDVRPGGPNLIERIEGGLLSYGNELTRANNPLECGFERYCRLDGAIDFIGREALVRIGEEGPARRIRGILFDGDPCPPCRSTWPLTHAGHAAGHVSSAIWSPRVERNVALGMLERAYWQPGQSVRVHCEGGSEHRGSVVALPFPSTGGRTG